MKFHIQIAQVICFAICTFSSILAENSLNDELEKKKINVTDCLNYLTPKPYFEAPVFSNDTENLSFVNCGSWKPEADHSKAPWRIQLVETNDTLNNCDGILISDKTVITYWTSTSVFQAFMRGNALQIHGGPCEMSNDTETCFRFSNIDRRSNIGLLSGQKVLDVNLINLIGLPFLYVWTITPLKLSDGLIPICLWNEDNTRNEQLQYFAQDECGSTTNLATDNKSNYVGAEQCYMEQNMMRREICEAIKFSICLNVKKDPKLLALTYLLVQKGSRFYLRGINTYYSRHRQSWIDLLVKMQSLIAYSTNSTLTRA
ncbi:Hypothetical predicted protein [Cloeon dipterum]|uniref:Uncharacterized protein n=1 Tax=Cloeon dipterum TaxID=197152 RepID=A0A8S1CWG7_9INSE|nr:Hypothetical predicted protein [Cloeon dipterum]